MKTLSTKEQMKEKEETTCLSLMRHHQLPDLKANGSRYNLSSNNTFKSVLAEVTNVAPKTVIRHAKV